MHHLLNAFLTSHLHAFVLAIPTIKIVRLMAVLYRREQHLRTLRHLLLLLPDILQQSSGHQGLNYLRLLLLFLLAHGILLKQNLVRSELGLLALTDVFITV